MTKLEAWKAWCESAGTPDLATEFTLEQSSHGKAFSFAWESGFVDGMQHQMKSSVEKALETKQEPLSQVKWDASAPLVMGEPVPLQSDRFSVDPVTGNVGIGTPSQEPVAWANSYDLQNFDMRVRTGPDLHHTVPLYTAPPQRTWVGLTDEEREYFRGLGFVGVSAIEAKLKEKNHG